MSSAQRSPSTSAPSRSLDEVATVTDRTIPALLDDAAARYGDRTWLRTDHTEVTFRGAREQIRSVAQALTAAGVRRGDLVVLTARNEPRYLLTILAATTLGATAVPTNPRGTEAELAGLLTQVRGHARVIVTDDGLISMVRRAKASAGAGAEIIDVDAIVSDRPSLEAQPPSIPGGSPVRETDVAIMIPTSGTTGRSKLVMQTHRAYTMAGEGFPYWMQLSTVDRLMTSLPLFHTNALAYSTMGSLTCGAGLILLPRFSASDFLDSARRHGATSFNAIGAMFEFLMDQAPTPDDSDSPLENCYCAPAPPKHRHLEIERRFGISIVCGYGMSESLYGMSWRPGTRPFGTLGEPRQHPTLGEVNSARVVDSAGHAVAKGQIGELLLSNPTVTPGYYGLPDETAAAVRDGWLHTGDLVTENTDGTYTFVARQKEVIRRRGENLSPAEVEGALLAHPDVDECAVVGVNAGQSEEEIKAYVRLVDGSDELPQDLATWVSQRLAAFKVPRYWQFVTELPYTPTGRVAKHQLPVDGYQYDLAPIRGTGTLT